MGVTYRRGTDRDPGRRRDFGAGQRREGELPPHQRTWANGYRDGADVAARRFNPQPAPAEPPVAPSPRVFGAAGRAEARRRFGSGS